jgi:hypothetical protein
MKSLEYYEKEHTITSKKDNPVVINDEDLNYFEKKYDLPAQNTQTGQRGCGCAQCFIF